MSGEFQLNPEQLRKLKEITNEGTGNFADGYDYMRQQIQSFLDSPENAHASDRQALENTNYWLEKAAEINRNDPNSEANLFIRDITSSGLLFDGKNADPSRVQENSDLIATKVLQDVLNNNRVPGVGDLLSKDVNTALSDGSQTLAGWGGAFYYWDMPMSGKPGDTVGRRIMQNPIEYEKFLALTTKAAMDTMTRLGAALDVATSEGIKLLDATIADYSTRLSEAERRVDELEQQFIKAQKRRQAMKIESPIDGIVQLSSITTVGQVVTAGAELMRVVPKNNQIEIEAYLPNRDAGFVKAGQHAVIKIEAYPFTRFGVIEGTVTNVATDAIPEPDAQQLESTAAREPQSFVPTGNVQRMQNLVFPITVIPDQTTIAVNGRPMPLTPGMAVTVEVKTGKRRILEYLFSPLVEITSQAMHEF
ncbi:HlyD family efflux transporter periplasmic adaptor subunit [Ochrobactrum sp. BTU1]|uniref:HlyD family efflux transporter periplasmic adaptor subunit n=1 Tax=Ochrobactrum sp. BTU1 TaxID=2840456 RepID=UPI001C057F00|nr:HlyD family efflux transporter periplasmic adaptor subunit [Ochrobactrum sp. BTU1]